MTKKAKPVMLDKDGYLTINPDGIQLPAASADTAGVVKVGDGLAIDESGVLSASGGGGGEGALVVYFTANGSGTVTAHDKTISDIKEAMQNGLDVVVRKGTASNFTQYNLGNFYHDYDDDSESVSFFYYNIDIKAASGMVPANITFYSSVLTIDQADTWTLVSKSEMLTKS